jgi:aminoglycoside 6-adenylyltransferase
MTPSSNSEPLDEMTSWAMARENIRAVLLTSTRIIPGGPVDALSDYDIILVLEDIHPFLTDRSWLNDFGEVLISYWDPLYPNRDYGLDQCGNVTQYTSGLKIDFSLWPVSLLEHIIAAPSLPPELDAGYRVLLDKDQLTQRMLPPSGKGYVPVQPTNDAFQLLINDFLSDAPYVAKCLWRDELMPARWCLDYDMKHIYLRRVLEWRVEMDHGWQLPVGNLGKGLKKHLPVHIWAGLEKTYAGSDIAANWQALEDTVELFRQVAREVGEHLGYPYPEGLHQRVLAYIIQIKRMPQP